MTASRTVSASESGNEYKKTAFFFGMQSFFSFKLLLRFLWFNTAIDRNVSAALGFSTPFPY